MGLFSFLKGAGEKLFGSKTPTAPAVPEVDAADHCYAKLSYRPWT